MAELSFQHISQRYGSTPIFDDFSLDVAAGRITVLVGPSGSGKSTLLRLAAGLERPSAGNILLDGTDITDTPPGSRDMAMVFQGNGLFPHMSVADNIGIGLKLRGVPRPDIVRRVQQAAATVGCADKLARMPGQLSGGEQQRVALARALVRNPSVFLLDEPLSSLDVQLRSTLRLQIQQLQQSLQATMLYVTHDQAEALMLGDRVGVISDGHLQQIGTPQDIYRRPANRFVATFIGSPGMNILPVPGRKRIEGGIRPEHIQITPKVTGASRKAGSASSAGTVMLLEMAGSETYVHLDYDDRPLLARVPADVQLRLGQKVGVVLPEKYMYQFDADSGATVVQASW